MILETILSSLISSAVVCGLVVYVWSRLEARVKKLEDKAEKQPETCRFHDVAVDNKFNQKIEERNRLVQRDIDWLDLRVGKLEARDKDINEIKIMLATLLEKITAIEKRLDKLEKQD